MKLLWHATTYTDIYTASHLQPVFVRLVFQEDSMTFTSFWILNWIVFFILEVLEGQKEYVREESKVGR